MGRLLKSISKICLKKKEKKLRICYLQKNVFYKKIILARALIVNWQYFEPEHIIIDELHLLLRICDKLLKNLILDTKTLDDKHAVHGEKSDFLGQLTEKIRGCGVSFYIWTKGYSRWIELVVIDGVWLWKAFGKSSFKIILVDHTVKIWNSFFEFISFRDVRNTRVL